MLLLNGFAFEVDRVGAEHEARETLARWTARGLRFSTDGAGRRCFDPVEVWHFFKRQGLEGRDSFWEHRFVRTARSHVKRFADTAGDSLAVTLRRTIAVDAPAGKPLRLRVPAPLGAVRRVDDVVDILGLDEARVIASEGRLEVRGTARGDRTVTIGATHAVPRAFVSVDAPDPLHLSPSEGLIVVSDEIRRLAVRLAGTAPRDEIAVRAFWDHLIANFGCGPMHYDQIDPRAPCDWIVDTGWFDCQLASVLFTALCRAAGIPARVVGGYFVYPAAPTNHFWAEAWLDGQGWLPFDFICWDLSSGGRDDAWTDHFFGRIDARMVCERLPLEFVGAIGTRVPPAWRVVQTSASGGVRIDLEGLDGAAVTSDLVRAAFHA